MSHVHFSHLHVHTQFSLLHSTCRVDKLIERAVELKFPSIAMTDQGNMFGTVVFYKKAMSAGIKPIIGLEAYLAPQSRFYKSSTGHKSPFFTLVLLAKNQNGYRNLLKLSSAGYLEGFYYRPRVDKELLKENSSDLIAIADCLRGEPSYHILNEQLDEAERSIREYQEIFGAENFYLELQSHGIPEQNTVRESIFDIASRTNAQVVASNNVYYINKEDAKAHDVLLCIGSGNLVTDAKRQKFSSDEFYLKSFEEMQSLFGDHPEVLENTVKIADQCNVSFDFDHTHIPPFQPPKGLSQENYLKELCLEGLKKKLGKIPKEYQERFNFEFNVIKKMGYTSYFLIVWDFIKYAKDHSIYVGPGRGSAAGSVISYALNITEVDPIQFGLLFERFLNPDRVSMPDIDIDFCYERRPEVIEYVESKYGQDNVAQIITFGTMAGRMAIRDVGRTLGMGYSEVDFIAKLIPFGVKVTIDMALKAEPRLKEMMEKDERVKELIELAKALEGLTRHASTHAAGVVISDKALTEYVPLYKTGDQVTTQFTMKDLEDIGLLKMDFLGLKTLTVVGNTVKILKKTKEITVDPGSLHLDDKKTYELLARGETFGIFQLESSGMRDLIRKLKPENIEEIADLLALYRPGPLDSGMVDNFIKYRNDETLVKYDHELLEPILKETFGVILYQEQVMRIGSDLAGFTLAQADTMRRAMGKKQQELLDATKKDFVEGAAQKGISKSLANKIFTNIEKFGRYGFNKSHSVAYSFISYQTAYLKANYPLEFMTALLTSEKDNTDKIVQYIEEATRLGIRVLPPSVNESFLAFTASGDAIRFGLSAIKGVGSTAIQTILDNRKELGKFTSIFHFIENVDLRLVNRKVFESLIKSGSLDCFGYKRSQLMAILDTLLDVGGKSQRDKASGQFGLFDGQSEEEKYSNFIRDIPDIDEWQESQLLEYEKDTLGFYVTSHPLARYSKTIKAYTSASSDTLSHFVDQQEVAIGGIIDSIKALQTKKGDMMAFAGLEDLNGKTEVIFFPEAYRTYQTLLAEGNIVFIRGRINSRDEIPKVIANEMIQLDQVKNKLTKVVTIDLYTTGLSQKVLEELKDILESHKGKIPVDLNFINPTGKKVRVQASPDYYIEATDDVFEKIEGLLGETSIKIKV